MLAIRRSARMLSRLAVAIVLIACSKAGTDLDDGVRASGGPEGDRYSVEIVNTGTETLQSVAITTGENQPPLEVARLAAGQRTAERAIGVLHTNPMVVATVVGKRREYHPVEGFTGFNPALPPGHYVITLKWNAGAEFLETVVEEAK